MRKIYNKKLAKCRQKKPYFSDESDKYKGVFRFPYKSGSLFVISTGSLDKDFDTSDPLSCWEHVSVSHARRCPTWDEMKYIKGIFWDDTETVVQFHPPKKDYVNNHSYVLDLWNPVHMEIELPPFIAVGVKSLGELKK